MATIKDVAKMAGVAISTVSKYINGGSVRSYNAVAIQDAIEALDFKINDVARALKTSRAMTIGVLIPSFENLFFTTLAAIIEEELQKHGYNVILCEFRNASDLGKDKLEFLISKRVDGLVLVPELSDKHIEKATLLGIPVVAIDSMFEGAQTDAVFSDSVSGSFEAVEELINLGHERIAIISGPMERGSGRFRLEGYRVAMEKHHLIVNESFVCYGDYSLMGGYKMMSELLELEDRPTAVFTTNYETTMGAMMALNEQGINVPEDISVIGFDDMDMTKLVRPPLSVVAQPLDAIGQETAKLLLRRIEGDFEDFPQTVKLKTNLIKRKSVKRLSS